MAGIALRIVVLVAFRRYFLSISPHELGRVKQRETKLTFSKLRGASNENEWGRRKYFVDEFPQAHRSAFTPSPLLRNKIVAKLLQRGVTYCVLYGTRCSPTYAARFIKDKPLSQR